VNVDTQEKSVLIETLMGIQHELAASRKEREKAQTVHVHLKTPRVSLETVLLSLASGLIAAATIYACVPK
jgi:uncharacterized membrane protein YbhN (UPF0104 family)